MCVNTDENVHVPCCLMSRLWKVVVFQSRLIEWPVGLFLGLLPTRQFRLVIVTTIHAAEFVRRLLQACAWVCIASA